MAEQIRIMSGNRLIISPYPGGEKSLASGPDIFAAVQKGTMEMGNGWPNWWSAHDPAWAVMNAGPFDLMNLDASMMFFLEGEGTNSPAPKASSGNLPGGQAWNSACYPALRSKGWRT